LVKGSAVPDTAESVEDYAVATLQLRNDTVVRLACSWGLNAGCDCIIDASFYGTKGGAAMRNIDGSFYDFYADRFDGTHRQRLVDPPDEWGGRAAIEWAAKLNSAGGFDPAAEQLVAVSQAIDLIYRRGSSH